MFTIQACVLSCQVSLSCYGELWFFHKEKRTELSALVLVVNRIIEHVLWLGDRWGQKVGYHGKLPWIISQGFIQQYTAGLSYYLSEYQKEKTNNQAILMITQMSCQHLHITFLTKSRVLRLTPSVHNPTILTILITVRLPFLFSNLLCVSLDGQNNILHLRVH